MIAVEPIRARFEQAAALRCVLLAYFGLVSLPAFVARSIALSQGGTALQWLLLGVLAGIDVVAIAWLIAARDVKFSWGLGTAALFRCVLASMIGAYIDLPTFAPLASHFGQWLGGL
jgi:branched-subunit amino acid transport protein